MDMNAQAGGSKKCCHMEFRVMGVNQDSVVAKLLSELPPCSIIEILLSFTGTFQGSRLVFAFEEARRFLPI
jgi:hypothetical protein